jgi:alkylated DNA repair dioxygenase AlkB
MFGRTVSETRWSTAWGRSYAYAGTMNPVRPILPEQGGAMVAALLERTNTLLSATSHPSTSSSVCDRKSKSSSNANNNAKSQAHGGSNGANNPSNAYNGCLQNWYMPEHCIGLHADDEKCMRADVPIFSLSWGGPRRFLFRAKAAYLPSSVDTASKSSLPASKATAAKVELILRDGDLLVMGGTCQKTHKHEVPKLRKTMDLPTGRRINWTIRAFC